MVWDTVPRPKDRSRNKRRKRRSNQQARSYWTNKKAGDARVQNEACSKGEEIGVGIHGGGQVMVVEEEEGKEKSSLKSLLSAVNAALNPLLQHMRRKRLLTDSQVVWKIEHIHSFTKNKKFKKIQKSQPPK
jgi:hypothetical protein